MHSECLPFSSIPHSTPLFLAYLHDFSRVRPFYVRPPLQTSWLADEAHTIRYDGERRERVATVLARQNRTFGSSEKALHNIERLRAGAAVVVTGQQVGLFGGPLFALLKALTAVRLAEEATRAGSDCVPLFWLATEDHDLAEVDHVALPSSDGALHTLRVAPHSVEGVPVSHVRFGQEIEPVVQQATELLGNSEINDALRASYHPGASLGEAFGRLFAHLFRDFGVILLDADDPELHCLAAPVYDGAIRNAAELDAALLAQGDALRRAGFHEQVKVTSSSTLLFAVGLPLAARSLRSAAGGSPPASPAQNTRLVIHRTNGNFTIGKEKLSQQELLELIAAAPERFSANVLLRPVVQDFLLPTLAYVGGPAEVAYFAQAAPVYEKLLGRVTPVWPRISVTVVEPHVQRLLERYSLSVQDYFQDVEHLRAQLAARTLPPELQHNFDAALASLNSSLSVVTKSLERLDPTLVEAARHAGAKMCYQLEHLRGRATTAELRRNQVLARHAAQLSVALFPECTLQERVTGGLYFTARYPDFLRLLAESASLTCPAHQILYL